MRLDASALTALNLMPGPQDGSQKSMSLYGLLNKCKTAQGSRLLMQWLKQPLLSVEEISKCYYINHKLFTRSDSGCEDRRQDLVEVFFNDTELRQSLQSDHLKSIPDLYRLAKRFQRGIATLHASIIINICRGKQLTGMFYRTLFVYIKSLSVYQWCWCC